MTERIGHSSPVVPSCSGVPDNAPRCTMPIAGFSVPKTFRNRCMASSVACGGAPGVEELPAQEGTH
jgi:hypothetical protein